MKTEAGWQWANKLSGWRVINGSDGDRIAVDVIGNVKNGFVIESRESGTLNRSYSRVNSFHTLRAAVAYASDYCDYLNDRTDECPVGFADKYIMLDQPNCSPVLGL